MDLHTRLWKKLSERDNNGMSLLMRAIYNNYPELLRCIKVSFPKLPINMVVDLLTQHTPEGHTAPMIAIIAENVDAFKVLIDPIKQNEELCKQVFIDQYCKGLNVISCIQLCNNSEMEEIVKSCLPSVSEEEYEAIAQKGNEIRAAFAENFLSQVSEEHSIGLLFARDTSGYTPLERANVLRTDLLESMHDALVEESPLPAVPKVQNLETNSRLEAIRNHTKKVHSQVAEEDKMSFEDVVKKGNVKQFCNAVADRTSDQLYDDLKKKEQGRFLFSTLVEKNELKKVKIALEKLAVWQCHTIISLTDDHGEDARSYAVSEEMKALLEDYYSRPRF